MWNLKKKLSKVYVYSYNSNKLPEFSSTFIYSSQGDESSFPIYITWGYAPKEFFF